MAKATVTADVSQTGNILLCLPTQRPLDGVFAIEDARQPANVVVRKLLGTALGIDVSLFTQAQGQRRTDAVNVAQRNVRRFIIGNVDTQNTRHAPVLLLSPDAA